MLDCSDDAHIKTLLDRVAHKQEIIMFAFNSQGVWLDFAAAMVDQLRSRGYLHHFAIATRECCRELHGIYPDAPCVSFELPGDHWRSEQGVTHLWIGRYKLANSIVRMGVNILVIDLDTIIRRDLYADLKAPPMRDASMIHMEEGFANGAWARPGGLCGLLLRYKAPRHELHMQAADRWLTAGAFARDLPVPQAASSTSRTRFPMGRRCGRMTRRARDCTYQEVTARPRKAASVPKPLDQSRSMLLSRRRGPVAAIPQVFRRADTVMKMARADHFRGNTMDQALLNDAINVRCFDSALLRCAAGAVLSRGKMLLLLGLLVSCPSCLHAEIRVCLFVCSPPRAPKRRLSAYLSAVSAGCGVQRVRV